MENSNEKNIQKFAENVFLVTVVPYEILHEHNGWLVVSKDIFDSNDKKPGTMI